jgi:hypothetical protein
MLFRRGLNAKQVQMWLGRHSPAFHACDVHLLSRPTRGVLLLLAGLGRRLVAPTSQGIVATRGRACRSLPTEPARLAESFKTQGVALQAPGCSARRPAP